MCYILISKNVDIIRASISTNYDLYYVYITLVLIVKHSYCINQIGGVMVSVRASCTVDRGFKPIEESY